MRDIKIMGLRPDVPTEDNKSNAIEYFQNNTLRPILKLQHPITKALLGASINFQKSISKSKPHDKTAYEHLLKHFLSTNIAFRSSIVGCVVGMMTASEFAFYALHTREINKRILSMQLKRYMSEMS